jgi:hypothetical protein
VRTRSSRSFCSALRSIRQSNNANESCTNDLSGVARAARANLASGPEHTFVQPASNPSTACILFHEKRLLHIF